MRSFATGGAGFAGRHLLALLPDAVAPTREEVDLLDTGAVRTAVREAAPEVVFHLAALASVRRSWEAPAETLTVNVAMTANLLEAVRSEAPEAAVVVVGSGEVYGPPARLPVDEEAPLRPQNPYAVSKAACDLLAGQYADAFDMRVVRMRPFNHAGPGHRTTTWSGRSPGRWPRPRSPAVTRPCFARATRSRRATSPTSGTWFGRMSRQAPSNPVCSTWQAARR